MGKRGPKPEPTVLKLAKGNPGKRPINKKEPKPEATGIEPPAYLDGESLKKWDSVVPGLIKTGVMTKADVETVARYCAMWEQWVKYLEQCRRGLDVLVIKDENGKVKYMQSSPAATMQMKLATAMLKIEQEFGLTPSARTGIVASEEKEPNEYEKWLAS